MTLRDRRHRFHVGCQLAGLDGRALVPCQVPSRPQAPFPTIASTGATLIRLPYLGMSASATCLAKRRVPTEALKATSSEPKPLREDMLCNVCAIILF